jgi:transcriptional regulator with XRE-family HTH domain
MGVFRNRGSEVWQTVGDEQQARAHTVVPPGEQPGTLSENAYGPEVHQVGVRLRQFRKALGLTLHEVAASVGTTPQTVSRLEKGEMTLSVPWIFKFCRVLSIHPAALFSAEPQSALRIVGTLDETNMLSYFPPERRQAVALDLAGDDLFAVRASSQVAAFKKGDVLLARPVAPSSSIDKDWGPSLVSVADEPPTLRRVVQSASGPWAILDLDSARSSLFTDRLAWLAPIVAVIRQFSRN